ncbi:MAG: MBOAT family protein [Bacteroidales bacterium]|nr:MBOAT family protein [Bacteroidales bacterium]
MLISSYLFYGWIHPWFGILIAVSTITDYFAGLAIYKRTNNKKLFLIISITVNLGMLGFFKYFNFFIENIYQIINNFGINASYAGLKIFLPVGISFYTFQTLSYTIDIYRNKLVPRKDFIDFAVFVSFFPQLVAGPIERAKRFLPQIENKRSFNIKLIETALPLLIKGFFKKIVIADNIAIFADKVFLLDSPSIYVLIAGTLAFTLQILADFSAYTDIARGVAKLLGFDLVRNFMNPYLAVSPSDLWRRWHISFSSWIRDYLYFSLGGSRVKTSIHFAFVLVVTMGLSGLWHGAAWTFVIWGIYHGLLVFIYHKIGKGGKWKPKKGFHTISACFIMFTLTVIGWMFFRATSIDWLTNIFLQSNIGFSGNDFLIGTIIIAFVILYSLPMVLFTILDKYFPEKEWIYSIMYGFLLVLMVLFFRETGQDFIYFQF